MKISFVYILTNKYKTTFLYRSNQ